MQNLHIKLRMRLFLLITIAYTVIATLGGLFLKFLIPGEYFGTYPIVSVFYWVMGLFLIYSLDLCKKKRPDRLLVIFFLIKFIKFTLAILFLIGYVNYDPTVKIQFTVSLIYHYFIYSFFEVYIYFLYDKKTVK